MVLGLPSNTKLFLFVFRFSDGFPPCGAYELLIEERPTTLPIITVVYVNYIITQYSIPVY